MTRHLAILAVALCAGCAYGQPVTNLWGTNDVLFTTGWNFTEAASNLTTQEKQMFNERANAMQEMPFMGIYGVQMVAAQVKALDAQREIEKILERVRALQFLVITNTVYVTNECKHDAWARNKLNVEAQ